MSINELFLLYFRGERMSYQDQQEMVVEANKLYTDLTKTFSEKKQFTLLNKLLDVEGNLRRIEE